MSDFIDIKEQLEKAFAEVQSDMLNKMTAEEKLLHDTAKRLLLLERDLKASGLSQTTDTRVTRLLDAIEKEHF
jgi:hypothetical protein